MLLNLCLGDFITACGLLAISGFNFQFKGDFGAVADVWRASWKCLILECTLCLSSHVSLAFSVNMSIHYAIHIPSLTKKTSSTMSMKMRALLLWCLLLMLATGRQSILVGINKDPHNYLCIPFVSSPAQLVTIHFLHLLVIIIDFLLCALCVCCYSYIYNHVRSHKDIKQLTHIKRRKAVFASFSLRIVFVVVGLCITWIPILVTQVIALSFSRISASVMLWVILMSFSVNLLLNPIMIIKQCRNG